MPVLNPGQNLAFCLAGERVPGLHPIPVPDAGNLGTLRRTHPESDPATVSLSTWPPPYIPRHQEALPPFEDAVSSSCMSPTLTSYLVGVHTRLSPCSRKLSPSSLSVLLAPAGVLTPPDPRPCHSAQSSTSCFSMPGPHGVRPVIKTPYGVLV